MHGTSSALMTGVRRTQKGLDSGAAGPFSPLDPKITLPGLMSHKASQSHRFHFLGVLLAMAIG